MGHGGPPCTPPHNSLGPIFFEALDHTEQDYVMPTEIFWVPLPVGGHFQNGRRCWPPLFLENPIFVHNFASMTGREVILVSLPMFYGTRNPMNPSLNP